MTPAQHGYEQCSRCRTWQKPPAIAVDAERAKYVAPGAIQPTCVDTAFCDRARLVRADRRADDNQYTPETQGDIWGGP